MDNLKPAQLVAECIGTFMLQAVFTVRHGDPVAMGATLAAMSYFAGPITGGLFNPALTISGLRDGADVMKLVATVFAQVIGAFAASQYIKRYAFA